MGAARARSMGTVRGWDSPIGPGALGKRDGLTKARPRAAMSTEATIAAVAALLFIAISIWWLLADNRLPGGGDPGRHLLEAIDLSDRLRGGELLAPLTYDSPGAFAYPPLVRSIGATVELLGLPLHDWGPIALNVLFVPLLVGGCYLTGSLVFGRFAGVLAAIFALGSAMVMQLFHVYLLDAPLAALVAISVWALLASDDLRDRRLSALAGALIGLSMLVKPIAPVFMLGPLALMLIRGGWRRGRSLALLAGAAAIVAAPHYLVNLGEYVRLSEEATVASTDPWTRGFGWTFEGWDRFGLESMTWYGWAAVNNQYLVPLLGLFAVGLIACLTRFRGRRHVPDLLAGLAVGYLAMTLLAVHDPRYTLPLVVFVAVVATGWIANIRTGWLAAAGLGLLALGVSLNLAANLGLVGTSKVTLPGDDPTDLRHPGALTIADKRGYVVGEPRRDPAWEQLFESASDAGVESARIDIQESATWGTDTAGFEAMANQYGIATPIFEPSAQRQPDLVVTTWWTSDEFFVDYRGFEPPCAHVAEGVAGAANPSDPNAGVVLSIVAQRQLDGRLQRWCEFTDG
jgi:Dolichyl-phosphate-mannose-protein mannosyltransferase